MKKLVIALSMVFAAVSSSAFGDGSNIPMKIKGVSGPTLAANGFPFTYNLWVRTEIPLMQFAKQISIVSRYSSENQTLNAHPALIVFPYSEYEGLLQVLFIVPEDQEKGAYHFSGELTFKSAAGKSIETMVLPPDMVEIGGQRGI